MPFEPQRARRSSAGLADVFFSYCDRGRNVTDLRSSESRSKTERIAKPPLMIYGRNIIPIAFIIQVLPAARGLPESGSAAGDNAEDLS